MKVKKQDILDILETVQPGLANKEIIEQSQSFIFKDKKVLTYNDEISVSCSIPYLDIEGAVKAEELIKLLNKLKVKEIDIEVTENEFQVHSKSTETGIVLNTEITLPLDEMNTPKTKDWIDLPKHFMEGLKLCIFSASSNETKPIMNCMKVRGRFIYSCDNYRVSRYDMGEEALDLFSKTLLLPARVVRELFKYKPIKYAVTGSWIHFQIESEKKLDIVFSCRGFEGKYPKVKSLLNVEGFKIKLPAKTKDVLERASIFAKGQFNQDTEVEVCLKENKMTILGKGDSGWFKERMKIDYKGDQIKFHIHPDFLSDSLNFLDTITVGQGSIKLESEKFIHVACLMAERE